jgi:hypothetical protein
MTPLVARGSVRNGLPHGDVFESAEDQEDGNQADAS